MSPTINSTASPARARFTLNLALSIVMAVFTVGASVTAAYYTKGADATKLSTLERTVQENKQEEQKAIDARVPRGELDAWRQVYVDSVQKDLNEIKVGVSQINQELLRQAETRKR